MSFSYEVFDRFGRLLAFLNRNQPNPNVPSPRPPSYNDRQLQSGRALPFFIWPNISPFRDAETVADAVPRPATANTIAESGDFQRARDAVKSARATGIGVFAAADPLRFEAFEIRYLGRREVPSRAVIDLSRNEDVMLRPQSYFRIPHPEDRLWVPAVFVPLFAARGWRLEGFVYVRHRVLPEGTSARASRVSLHTRRCSRRNASACWTTPPLTSEASSRSNP